MSYLLSGGSRGLNPWIEATACQVVTVPPAGGSATTTTSSSSSSGSQSQQRKPRIVQVLGRGGGWVDPATISADHPQLRRGDRWCLSCPPVLVLSDGRNTVTAFLTPPPRSAASGTTMAQNNTAAAAAGNAASNAPSNARLPSEEVSRICRRGTLIRIRDWTYTTMMLGGGRHYRHLTGTTATGTGASSSTATRTCVTAAVLPQNVPLTTPLALSVPWSSVEFIAGENGTVPIHRSNALVDVNSAVEVRRILADNGGSGGGSGTGIGPRNHLELSRRIRGWEEHFADIGTGADAAAAAAPSSSSRRTAASSAAVASLPPVRVSAAHAAAILAGRPRAPPPRADDASASSNKPMATTVRLGDPAKLVGTRRNLSALLQTGTRRSGDENRDRQQQQGRMQEQEREEPQRHRHGERREVVRVGDASRLLSSSVGRAALRQSVQVASTSGSATAGAAAAAEDTSQSNDEGVNTAGVEDATAAKNKTVSVGDVRRLMASKRGRTALRSALSRSANAPAPVAAPAPAPVAAAEPVQAPPPIQKRRRGGVPKRSRQQQEASANEGASTNIAIETKPTSAQETLAALQSLDTTSLHSLFNQILSSGVEPEDDMERDSEEVPAPRKLAAMREAPAREGEGSNGKEDEPLDLTFLLSDNEAVESSPDDGRGDEKKKAAADEDDESDDNDEEEGSEPVVGIGDMLVPPTQEQQQGDTLSHDEQPVGAKRSQEESESAISKQVASGHREVEEPAVPPKPQVVQKAPPDDAVDTNLQPEDESDEEDLSQETTQGSGENTAEGSPKKCPPTLRRKGVEEVDSDATVDENGASRHVAVTTEKPKEHESSDSDTTAGEAELRLPITSSKKITKPAPTTTATNESPNQGARSHAVPPPPKSRRRLYSAYDSSSSSDSDDWDSSTPAATTTEKKEGGTTDARKRLKHFGAAPPSAKRPRPAPKKAPVSAFSIQAMLARKRK